MLHIEYFRQRSVEGGQDALMHGAGQVLVCRAHEHGRTQQDTGEAQQLAAQGLDQARHHGAVKSWRWNSMRFSW
ncbi:hypothetical protein D9M68_999450 [compost metagenome]